MGRSDALVAVGSSNGRSREVFPLLLRIAALSPEVIAVPHHWPASSAEGANTDGSAWSEPHSIREGVGPEVEEERHL
jgi:hypothetical protein